MNVLSQDLCFFICSFAVLLYCIVYYYSHKTPQRDRSRVFELIMFNMLFTSIAAAVANVMDVFHSPEQNIFNFIQEFAQTCYFTFHLLLAPLFALYVVLVNNWGDIRTLKGMLLFLSPAFLLEIFVLTNPLTGFVFYYQDNIIYTRGPIELLMYAEAAGYMAFAIHQLWIYRVVLVRSTTMALWFFVGCSLLSVAVQFLFPWFKLELFMESLSLVGIMLLIEMEDSHTDAMTGVYNRHMFIADNKRYIRSHRTYMVMIITLLNFKTFLRMFKNGDLEDVVKSIVFWIIKNTSGTVYRISQDKIAVVTTENRTVCENFTGAFKELMLTQNFFDNTSLPLSASIDIVCVPEDIQNAELLTELGDEIDDRVSPGLVVHSEEAIEKVKRRMEIEQLLQSAIHDNSLVVHYQPIWNAETGLFDSAEALVRLNDPMYGLIPPMEFIPIAEQNGMINDVGRIVFEKVCQFWHEKQPERYGLKDIEVNLSVFQLYTENLDVVLGNILKKYGVRTDHVNFEITESESLNENEIVKGHYKKLCQLGLTFSLDDFGTGYSNLSQIVDKNFKNIKADKGLLWSEKNSTSQKLLLEFINLLRKLGFNVIQEGVETKEQLDLVLKAGANKIQGFYFSKPLDDEAFLDFIRNRNTSLDPVKF